MYMENSESMYTIKSIIDKYGEIISGLNVSKSVQEHLQNNFCLGIQSAGKHNVALNKAIIHNAIVAYPNKIYHDSHLVDGIKNGQDLLGGCTKLERDNDDFWIMIDLIEMYTIREIIMYPPNISGYNEKMSIFVTNWTDSSDVCIENAVLHSMNKTSKFTCQSDIYLARFINISLPEISNITICEIEAYCDNLALNADVFVSNVKSGSYAYAEYPLQEKHLSKKYTSSSTSAQNGNFFYAMFLKGKFLIYGIDLYGISISTEFQIFVTNRNFLLDKTLLKSEECCKISKILVEDDISLSCVYPLIGEFVIISSNYSNHNSIVISRIEIRGLTIDKADFVNNAFGKPAWFSSTLFIPGHAEEPFYATFATDGFTKHHFSLSKPKAWLLVDLLRIVRVDYTAIKLRHIIYKSQRYTTLNFKILETINEDVNKFVKIDASECSSGDLDNFSAKSGSIFVWKCSPNKIGRFLLIYSLSQNVEVYELYIIGLSFDNKYFSSIEIPMEEAFANNNSFWDYDNSPLKVIDGNFYNLKKIPRYSSCSKLTSESEIILTIKFKSRYYVNQIILYPLFDTDIDSLYNVSIYVAFDNGVDRQFCGRLTDKVEPIRSLILINCHQPIEGNQLLIVKNLSRKNELHFCEVKAFGRLSALREISWLKITKEKKLKSSTLILSQLQKEQTFISCLILCKLNMCLSFSYNFKEKECLLTSSNITNELEDSLDSAVGHTLLVNVGKKSEKKCQV
ncbi:DgyrCDS14727 [Dimorphilus gyrociliatus]|uniref:DgyrCDS14727 n=1 Tax=Dimorphilus gyrociliatus TaxID=2664684 RepID=A0A7I8WEV4_9ANNE|nr:DgyrCDS14727 [Dimorphilus gyrociliatus]